MVFDITFIYQQTVCFFMADLAFCFRLKQQSVPVMLARRKSLFEDQIEQRLLEELTASNQSSCSDDDSNGRDDLTVGDVIGSECSDNESDDVQFATASNAPSALSATFMWEDMTNYVGQREQFVDNCGPQNEAQNETHCAKAFKMFFDDELVELIVRETNTYAAQKIRPRSFIPLCSRMWDWKPVTNKDKIYVVLALFMLMGIIQKPTLRSYFSKNCVLATPIFGSIISMDQFESICNFMHFNNNDNIGTYQEPSKLFKIYPVLSHLNTYPFGKKEND